MKILEALWNDKIPFFNASSLKPMKLYTLKNRY